MNAMHFTVVAATLTVSRIGRLSLALLIAALLSSPGLASDLEDTLSYRWEGAYVVVLLDVKSDCAGFFNDNEVRGAGVKSSARHRLDSGELGRVHSVNLKRKDFELEIELLEPRLMPRRDGPFELFDEAMCKIELEVPVDKKARRGGADEVDRQLGRVLQRHGSLDDAEQSDAWNRRTRAPYPADYDRTVAEHARWQAQRTNRAVQEKLDWATDAARDVGDDIEDTDEYLRGFAAGVKAARGKYYGDCSSVLATSESFYGYGTGKHEQGRRDGNVLITALELIDRLPRCFVDEPPPPR